MADALMNATEDMRKALTHCLGLLCETGDLNNYRNLSNEELGAVWVATAKQAARALTAYDEAKASAEQTSATRSADSGHTPKDDGATEAADKPCASDSLLTPPSRSEAEARIQMALKVARNAASHSYSAATYVGAALHSRKALDQIIRILDDGSSKS